jgi:hypothetical protein
MEISYHKSLTYLIHCLAFWKEGELDEFWSGINPLAPELFSIFFKFLRSFSFGRKIVQQL